MRSNSNASHLHAQILEALGKDTVSSWVDVLADEASDFKNALELLTEDPSVRSALRELRMGGDASLTAWRWLTGQTLKSSELNQLRISRNLGDVSTADLAAALVGERDRGDDDVERALLRPGNVASADDWLSVLESVIARYRDLNVHRFFRGDAAFAVPELYEFLEAEGYQ